MTCALCNQECSLRAGMEETKYCDSCAHWRVEELESMREYVLYMLNQMPSGIDEEADENDTSPEDMNAHICGLIWQKLGGKNG